MSVSDWFTTASSNTPAGTESIRSGDDQIRQMKADIASYTRAGSDLASASTLNLDSIDTLWLAVTGTTTVTAVTLTEGHVRFVRATGAFQMTASASLIVNGSTSVNYTTTAGDLLFFEGYGSSVVRVWVVGIGSPFKVTIAEASAAYFANDSFTTQIPLDNTVPQSSEGTQVLSVAITPKSTTNKLRCTISGQASLDGAGNFIVAAFAGGSNAVWAQYFSSEGAGAGQNIASQFEFVPGVTSEVTVSIRAGPTSALTLAFNGSPGNILLGGAAYVRLLVQEIQA